MQEFNTITASAPAPKTRAEAWAAAEAAIVAGVVSGLRKPTARQLKLAKAYGPYALDIRWNAGKVLVRRLGGQEVWIPLVDHRSRGANPFVAVGRPLYLDYCIVKDDDATRRQREYLAMQVRDRPGAAVEFIFHGVPAETLAARRCERAAARVQRAAEAAWEAASDEVRSRVTRDQFVRVWTDRYPMVPYWLR